MAFPVGYELLHGQFGELFDWSEAQFWFCDRPTTFASEFAEILRAREPYRILRVERHHETFTPRHQPAHWHFTVYPVLRSLKSIARATLLAEPCATLQRFIASSPTHANYYNRVDVIFDPADGNCRAEQLREI